MVNTKSLSPCLPVFAARLPSLKTTLSVVNRAVVVLLIFVPVGCMNLLGPDRGAVPKDPGTLVVRVRDQSGGPVSGASVSVEMPNSVGGVFTESSQTDSRGTHTF
jgi:hypothetical protein